ncbi:MAG: radical SAM protein [Candidatus Dadabacteria bacterium]|nr:MAG: radical SAM protein [Candidatus Dadabacteria bacterium]
MPVSDVPIMYWVRGGAAGALYSGRDGRIERVPAPLVPLVERAIERGCVLGDADPGAEERHWLELAGLEGAMVRRLDPDTVHLDDRPRLIWLELTGRCNYTCVHCYAESDPAPRDEMPADRWFTLLDEAARLGFSQVQLTGGDPAMHPALPALLEHVAALPFTLAELYTNASLLTDRLVRQLADSGVHLAASFYSADPATYDAITGVSGSFDRAVRGLRRALAAGIPVRIGLVEMPQNIHGVPRTIEFLADLGISADRITRDRVRPAGRGREVEGCGHGSAGFVSVNAIGTRAAATGFRRPQPLPTRARTATTGNLVWNTCWSGELAIDPMGQVFPCIFSRTAPIGTVATQSLADCLRGPAVTAAWQHHLGDAEGCRGCEFRYGCFDCRALTVNVTGQAQAKPPTCIYDPASGRIDAHAWVERLPIDIWLTVCPRPQADWRVISEVSTGPWVETAAGARAWLSWLGAAVLDLADGSRSIATLTETISRFMPDVDARIVLAMAFELEVQGLLWLPDPEPAVT